MRRTLLPMVAPAAVYICCEVSMWVWRGGGVKGTRRGGGQTGWRKRDSFPDPVCESCERVRVTWKRNIYVNDVVGCAFETR